MAGIILSLLLAVFAGGTSDQGSGIDPNGSSVSTPWCGFEGSGLDPYGRPCTQAALNGDEGSGIDPLG